MQYSIKSFAFFVMDLMYLHSFLDLAKHWIGKIMKGNESIRCLVLVFIIDIKISSQST